MGIFIPSYPRGFSNSNYAPRFKKGYKKSPAVTFMFDANNAWSAAAAVTRINNGYLKEALHKYDEVQECVVLDKEANKVLVRKMLDAGQGWTDEDAARGAKAREYWQAQLMKIVSGTANDFESNAIKVANKEQIESAFDLAVLSSLVASAERGMAKDAANDAKSQLSSVHVGNVGEQMVLKGAEVMTVGAISDFGKYRVDAKFEGNIFTWWSGKTYAVGATISVKGKVKGHIKDRATNAAVTQLNYVKEA